MFTATTKDDENNIFSKFHDEERAVSGSIDFLNTAQPATSSASRDLLLKRLFDVYVSLIALIILSPLLIVIAVLIRLESRGSPMFSQTRWGKDGKKITVYKFRSMLSEACDPSGVIQTVENDARVTVLGRILRKTNLDELPQLFNVLRGDMSLVGPRCHAIGMLAGGMLYEELVPAYHRRHSMRPGLTGLAQMRGLRGPTDRVAKARARINADLYYIENFSFWLDMKIIAGTIVSELRGGNGF
ncbi:exopolysaccharide production CDP-diacylglycerol-serine O-phosphatidyltransferase protein (plasmid) [Rhizobium etli CIAT 652]|uniref:Exopolysaccharide production CDP-diacylglycerol-serine O-phosphatidyltransferase protein n=1 Tax=Rhizobium etli (strain CIAT 652) TaxID=491916 RepID=B3Q3Q0_RHIE6|nr:exopolysaccharide production CDP-diacylglycerol-serine O-phosphatidyltransferase protein [Rhizobium etli CIAT 652]